MASDPGRILADFLGGFGLRPLDAAALDRLAALHALLLEANRHTNLTRITTPDEYYIKHVADSLAALALWPECFQPGFLIADVGCGAGFPGLPLAIACPDCQFVEIDSTAKKTAFVAQAVPALGLENVTVVTARACELGYREGHEHAYDLVLARAVSSSAALLRECERLLLPDSGALIAYKTPNTLAEEQAELRPEARRCHLRVQLSPPFALPAEMGQRQLCLLRR